MVLLLLHWEYFSDNAFKKHYRNSLTYFQHTDVPIFQPYFQHTGVLTDTPTLQHIGVLTLQPIGIPNSLPAHLLCYMYVSSFNITGALEVYLLSSILIPLHSTCVLTFQYTDSTPFHLCTYFPVY